MLILGGFRPFVRDYQAATRSWQGKPCCGVVKYWLANFFLYLAVLSIASVAMVWHKGA